jgi:hypothetical protein
MSNAAKLGRSVTIGDEQSSAFIGASRADDGQTIPDTLGDHVGEDAGHVEGAGCS